MNREIEKAFKEFQSSLADGQNTELSILYELSKFWNIDIQNLTNEKKAKLAVKIEDKVYSKIDSRKVFLANQLSIDEHTVLLTEIANCICQTVGCSYIPPNVISETQARAINEISRAEAWIYRDWQIAIGDFLLKEITSAPKRYDVMGFGEFEECFNNKNKWVI